MYENLDLNIQNYNLNDLLNLFKLNTNFTEEELKNAKKIVLKTHPDKSNLDKKYTIDKLKELLKSNNSRTYAITDTLTQNDLLISDELNYAP